MNFNRRCEVLTDIPVSWMFKYVKRKESVVQIKGTQMYSDTAQTGTK